MYPRCQYRDDEVGRQLLMLRTRAVLTQTELADGLGVHRRTVQNWEAGVGLPGEQALRHLIALYMARGTFTAGREHQEAEALWRLVSADAARPFGRFDGAWFAGTPARPGPTGSTADARSRAPGQAPAHNLPRPLTTCVGREGEAAAVARHLADPEHRLITLVGMGGVGKTRLALEVAWGLVRAQAGTPFRDGVYIVPLADVAPAGGSAHSADAFAAVLADALGLALSGLERPCRQVAGYLRGRRVLLILDSFEHLLDLTPVVVDLLEQVPTLKVLATSRARIDVRGEQVVAVEGLPYPPSAAAALSGEVYAALELFRSSAAAHAPQLRWPADELAAAAEICRRVEGVPLAIELAASLVRMLSVCEIAAELAAGGDLLHTSQRDVPPRHRSMQAALDRSWRLLAPDEQRVASGLAVFRGGFDRRAAGAVAGADLRSLAALINHSLLRECAAPEAVARYGLHELMREYASSKLQASGDDAYAAVCERHSRYYLAWAAARLPELRGDRPQGAQADLHREIDNIRAAWRWAAAHGDLASLGAAAAALVHFYELRGWFREGAELLRLAADSCARRAAAGEDSPATRAWARLLACQGWLSFRLGQIDPARALLERSLALLEPLAAPGEQALARHYLAAVAYHAGGGTGGRALPPGGLPASAPDARRAPEPPAERSPAQLR